MASPTVYEGNLHAHWVPSIADESAPTVTEIEAGVELTPSLTADGVSPNHTENTVSTDMLSGFIKQSVGTEGVTFNLTMLRYPDEDPDEPYDNFDTRGKSGYLVLANDSDGTTSGDVVEVYPAEAGRRKRVQTAANSHQAFTVLVTVSDDFTDDATVAV